MFQKARPATWLRGCSRAGQVAQIAGEKGKLEKTTPNSIPPLHGSARTRPNFYCSSLSVCFSPKKTGSGAFVADAPLLRAISHQKRHPGEGPRSQFSPPSPGLESSPASSPPKFSLRAGPYGSLRA